MTDIVDRMKAATKPGGWGLANHGMLLDAAAEIEALRAALDGEPVLTEAQHEQLTNGFGAILPAPDIFRLGWKTAMKHAKDAAKAGDQQKGDAT